MYISKLVMNLTLEKIKVDNHNHIHEKINYFLSIKKIPNMIFHGPSGSGKRTIVKDFINKIYNHDKKTINKFVMMVDCAQGAGISFIREELKFFAKTHINYDSGRIFKTIILLNGDKLTIDAQSALRCCIEQFTHTTRFFIILEDKFSLLKPILSRFCDIYIPLPIIIDDIKGDSIYDSKITDKINLHTLNIDRNFHFMNEKKRRIMWLKKYLDDIMKKTTHLELSNVVDKIYNKGYSALDLIQYIECKSLKRKKKYEILLFIMKIKSEFRNEQLLMFIILYFLFFRSDYKLENISFM